MTTAIPSPPARPTDLEVPAAPTPRWSALDIARALGQPDPTDEQQAIIEAPLTPLLVVAGAGAGKTETMAARVVWLVANGLVEPAAVLGLTFTRKAAAELATRVRRRLRDLARAGITSPQATGGGALGGGATVTTYHSYAGSLVAEHGLRLGLPTRAQVLGPAAAWQLASELVEGWDGPMDEVRQTVGTVVDAVLALAGECAEHLVSPAEVDRHLAALIDRVDRLPRRDADGPPGPPYAEVAAVTAALRARRQLLPLVEAFSARKRAAGQLDFADQLALAAQLAAVAEVASVERDRHRVVLLDEYQDTSHAQLVLLSRLYGARHPVTAVGDPQQAIYGWRGASAGALEAFTRSFAPVRVAYLSTSWRNDRAVLAAANTLSRPLRERSATLAAPDLRARPGAGAGAVRVGWYDTVEEEAQALADELAGIWAADEPGTLAGRPRRTVAVLCRTRHQIPPIEAALRARGLPVEVVGLGGLLATPEVADVVAVLRVLHDPSRGDALVRLLAGPRWRLGPRDLHRLGQLARHTSTAPTGPHPAGPPPGGSAPLDGPGGEAAGGPELVEPAEQPSLVAALDALLDPPGARWGARLLSAEGFRRARQLAGQLRTLRQAGPVELPELVDLVIRVTGVDVEAAARAGRSGAPSGQHPSHLTAFADAVADFADHAAAATLGGLLAWLSAAEERERGLEPGPLEVNTAAVSLLTVHAAKGLEWDVVAVPGLSSGVLPAQPDAGGWLVGLDHLPYPLRGDAAALPHWRWDTAATGAQLRAELARFRQEVVAHELVEERRIAYVALTRARSLLLASGHRWGDGRRPRQPSPFLAEILDQVPPVSSPPARTPADVSVLSWAPTDPTTDNPRDAHPAQAAWPVDPLGPARPAWEAGAALVRAAMAAGPAALAPAGDLPEGVASVIDRWQADAAALLAERAAAARPVLDVPLPTRLTASQLTVLARDPDGLAADLRRPLPRPVRPATRRGTSFHSWVEARFARQGALIELDELTGAADDCGSEEPAGLAQLQEAFLASEWADRVPLAVEVPFEVRVGSVLLAGRADAVFQDADGRFDVVDWKTGRPPGPAERAARAVQLAVYRLAWARRRQVPLDAVRAAFFYTTTGQTVRPVDVLDEAGIIALIERLPTPQQGAGTSGT